MTTITLIVADDDTSIREAERYLGALPADANLHGVCRTAPTRDRVREAASDAGVHLRFYDNPEDAIRTSELVVVFGPSPFSEADSEILRSQGIPVEQSQAKRAKPRRVM